MGNLKVEEQIGCLTLKPVRPQTSWCVTLSAGVKELHWDKRTQRTDRSLCSHIDSRLPVLMRPPNATTDFTK